MRAGALKRPLAVVALVAATVLPSPRATRAAAFSEVPLVDHDGESVLLHRDLLHGRVVVVNSFFTSCPTVCPRVTRRMKGVVRWLGKRLGREVHVISFTVDPETDTPERLRAYREHHGIDEEGWRFVTGEPEQLDLALRELGFYSDMAENHTSIVLVGNEPVGTWRKADGLGKKRDIVRLVRLALSENH